MKLERYQQEKDYTTGCLLDFDYFEKNYRIIAVDLSKQKALYADSRAKQQIMFLKNQKKQYQNFQMEQQKFCK